MHEKQDIFKNLHETKLEETYNLSSSHNKVIKFQNNKNRLRSIL